MNRIPLCFVVQALESEFVSLELDGIRTRHVVTGFGKVNAAVNLMDAIVKDRPDFVINLGTAGSFLHQVDEIVVCNRFVDRDLAKLKDLDASFEMDDRRHRDFFESLFSFNSYGVCSTGDQFVTVCQGAEDVYDMEAFAFSRVCRLYDIPFISVKYVTDRIGENSVKAWADKLADARSGLAFFIKRAAKVDVINKRIGSEI